MKRSIPVGVSARHVHLSEADLEKLFGTGAKLTVFKDLSQPGQYAANEKVDIVTEKGAIKGVRVLGPTRKQTQVEVSLTDALKLKIAPPIRDSGNVAGSAKCKLVGPCGEVDLSEGTIAAFRHIHMTPADAEAFGIKDKDIVSVKFCGERGLTFDQVLIRVNKDFRLEMHIDTDEANAAKIGSGCTVEMV
ncbi:MAG: phosphate propanoyltransferase [Negativicutes bacterium]|jgi:propanediol utilization protein